MVELMEPGASAQSPLASPRRDKQPACPLLEDAGAGTSKLLVPTAAPKASLGALWLFAILSVALSMRMAGAEEPKLTDRTPIPIILETREIHADEIAIAREHGVDLILMRQFFADEPQAIQTQLDAAKEAGVGIIGGFGFRRRSEDYLETIEQFGEHPALVAWLFNPHWLPEGDDRKGDFIRSRSKKPIVHAVHQKPPQDLPLDWASVEMLLAERAPRSLVLLAQGGDRRDWRNWQPFLAAAVGVRGIVFDDFQFLPGRDVPHQELARPLMEIIKAFVPIRDVLAQPTVQQGRLNDGKLVTFLKKRDEVPYLLAVNTDAKPLKATLTFPGAGNRLAVWGTTHELHVNEGQFGDSIPGRTARLYIPVRPETEQLRAHGADGSPGRTVAESIRDRLLKQTNAFERRLATIKQTAARFGRHGLLLRRLAIVESAYLGKKVEVPASEELMEEVDDLPTSPKEKAGPAILQEEGLRPQVQKLLGGLGRGNTNVSKAEADRLEQLLAEKSAELGSTALLWWDEEFEESSPRERVLRPGKKQLKSDAKGLVSNPVCLANLSDYPRDLLVTLSGPPAVEILAEPVSGPENLSETARQCLAARGYSAPAGFAAPLAELGECVVAPGTVRRLRLRADERLAGKSVSVGLRLESLDQDADPISIRWSVKFGESQTQTAAETEMPDLPVRWADPESRLWQQSVWLNLDPLKQPRPAAPFPEFELGLYQNEDENASFLATNTGEGPLTLAVFDLSGFVSEFRGTFFTPVGQIVKNEKWHQQFCYRTERVPRATCGPLPLLNALAEVTIPPGQTREVFMTFSSADRKPGTYEGSLAVVALNRGSACSIPVKVTVWPIHLPTRAPFPVYAWDYSGDDERTIRSLVRHKFNHFMMGTPTFSTRPGGEIDMDFQPVMGGFELKKENGRFVNSYGFIEAFEEQMETIRRKLSEAADTKKQMGQLNELLKGGAVDEEAEDEIDLEEDGGEVEDEKKGEEDPKKRLEFMSEEWQRIFRIFVKRWMEFLEEKGLRYDDFAFQTWDEAGLEPGEVEKVVAAGPIVREVAPKLRLVMDPGSAGLKEMAPFTDIWIPHCGSIWGDAFGYQGAVDRMNFFRDLRKENPKGQIWMYTTRTNFASLDALNYFRIYFLKGWCLGLDGVAKFSVSYFYGKGGRHPYKSYEAWREGAEDFQRLWMLREAIGKAEKAGASSEQLKSARTVLRRAAWECVGDDWFALDPERKTRVLAYWKEKVALATIEMRMLTGGQE